MRRVPRLTDAHKHRRLEFAGTNMGTNWAKFVWSDENKFNLDGCDGQGSYWHDIRKEPMYFSRRNFGGGSLMIWGLSAASPRPFSERTKRAGTAFLNEHSIPILDWPPCSPDLNPIENLGGILVQKVYANNKQYRTINELRLAVVQVWDAIEPGILENLANSMPSRLLDLISG
ncbi:hypothetical protein OESDEN_01380 [Oesophagostomum dentatum]|uniref:Tc1-like transposase DDE domain-containing protein n=1 Tax=Oesophagostomum dentatum TaxID=61180 RepID=A0A0B1TRD8_OESDE|nr:hypothetical protein OESDEN_01380 [Oesophagostomum dentatum]